MSIVSKNPATGQVIKEYTELTENELKDKLSLAEKAFLEWKQTPLEDRIDLFKKLAELFKTHSEEYGKIITEEMGKPLAAAKAEVEKCAWNAEYFSENATKFLAPKKVETEFKETYQRFDPLGIILLVMPWNFPFWQALRQAIPTIIAGNTVVLKHASNVPGSALKIQEVFEEAGFPKGVFQTLLIGSDKVEFVLSDFRVRGVSLTGSDAAGSAVAQIAGKYVKKSVMELGGNDPFIVFEDADLDKAVNACSTGRLNNSGQVCNSPKRAIVLRQVADEFIEKLKQNFEAKIVGDPMDPKTELGPLSSEKTLHDADDQVKDSIAAGAKLITGGEQIGAGGNYYKPTILVLNPDKPASKLHESNMPAYHEEIFGPISSVIIVDSREEAITIANDSKYGLGASIWTTNIEEAKKYLPLVEAGSVNINKNVSSDPRITIGGVKNSGFGRELSEFGLYEFTNIKSVIIEP